ncbi:MAG: hypothetical protein ACK55I_22330, partial [bacterium]
MQSRSTAATTTMAAGLSSLPSADDEEALLSQCGRVVKAELAFTKDAGRMLTQVKQAVRGEQQVIAQMKTSWKNRQRHNRVGPLADSLRTIATTADINEFTAVVNFAIEQLRVAK